MRKQANEDVTKLPRWAQHHIAKLEADIAYYGEKFKAMDAQQSEVYIERGFADENIFLPPNSRIAFTLPTGTITVHVEEKRLELYANDALQLRPSLSNVVYATVVGR